MNKSVLFLLVISVSFMLSCNSSDKNNENETVIEENIDARNIGKPEDLFPGLELPQSLHAIKTTEENTIITESGTEIFVPDNAFVDKSGKAVSAEITIKYKEIKTPSDIRKLGGAIFADRRYDHVFVYHNSAPSYYAARGFRGSIRV